MKAEDQAVSFWSKCYVLKNLRAKIGEKKIRKRKRNGYKWKVFLRHCIKLLNTIKHPFYTVIQK